MRLRLTLRPLILPCRITLNYPYYLSSAVYRWIEVSSPEWSAFLHTQGFSPEVSAKRFRHFCFSQLMVPKRTISNGTIEILSDEITWYTGMPIDEPSRQVERSLQHLVIGIFEKQELYIGERENRFVVEQVETLPEPEWSREMKFRLLSPVTVSVPEERNGRLIPHYLRPDDARLSEALRKNIINKYISLFRSAPEDDEFQCTLDVRFIAARGGPEKVSKLITIKAGSADETKVRGFMCPVTIEGNAELMKLAYDSGLGEKGSLGFGMMELIK